MKAIECLAKIKLEKDFNFINHAYVEASIIVDRQEKTAIPTEAIIKSGNGYFVYAVEKMDGDNYFLRKQSVIPGKNNGSYTEISTEANLEEVLVSGVYNLPGE